MGMQNSKYLVAGYPFEGNANDIKGVNNGTISGATFVDGKIGKAASFDGIDDKIGLPNSTFINVNEFSLSAWVYIKSPITSPVGVIINRFNCWGLTVTPTKKFRFYTDGLNQVNMDSSMIFEFNTWYHLCGTFKNGVKKLYINTRLDASATLSGTISNSSNAVGIGGFLSVNDFLFKGLIDSPRIRNKALTQSEIQRDYLNLPIL